MEKNMEELLFNLSCIDETERVYFGDWIYYINSSDLGEEGDGSIWRVKTDGTENRRVQKSDTRVIALIGVDNHWVYFMGKKVRDTMGHSVRDIMKLLFLPVGLENMKMTIHGNLERSMSSKDEENWNRKLDEMEEELW